MWIGKRPRLPWPGGTLTLFSLPSPLALKLVVGTRSTPACGLANVLVCRGPEGHSPVFSAFSACSEACCRYAKHASMWIGKRPRLPWPGGTLTLFSLPSPLALKLVDDTKHASMWIGKRPRLPWPGGTLTLFSLPSPLALKLVVGTKHAPTKELVKKLIIVALFFTSPRGTTV